MQFNAEIGNPIGARCALKQSNKDISLVIRLIHIILTIWNKEGFVKASIKMKTNLVDLDKRPSTSECKISTEVDGLSTKQRVVCNGAQRTLSRSQASCRWGIYLLTTWRMSKNQEFQNEIYLFYSWMFILKQCALGQGSCPSATELYLWYKCHAVWHSMSGLNGTTTDVQD